MNMCLSSSLTSHQQVAIQQHATRGLRAVRTLALLFGLFALGGCDAAPGVSSAKAADAAATIQPEGARMWMTIAEQRFAITLADTEAARAFAAMLSLTIEMPDLNSNEKHAQLPRALPTSAIRPGTIRNGDLMLYGASTLVLFYQTFDSIYPYTRLGRVDDPAGLAQVLGRGSARITFSKN
ncbi:MAG: cyclophilin-like fold protein [Stenotrophomonas sp.]